MKTRAWTPSPSLLETEFSIEDQVIFYSSTSKVDKTLTLIGALMAGASYAGTGMAFELRNTNQELLVVYQPGVKMEGYDAIQHALREIAFHMDQRVAAVIGAAVENMKGEAVRLYEQGVMDGIASEKERMTAAIAGDAHSAASPASEVPASASEVAHEAVAASQATEVQASASKVAHEATAPANPA